ncbi:ABC transporter substrate-binding protein [Actinotalea sp. K2]|uniref:ABC transporter substrate-binding protein n=1 Tax=Actinotalea sp. K2 TaxID=2939438 RepID=UPI002017320E|nr:ABC transporter substrate-binding protein [Actinotalea sp. K2]MCL3859894.1 ABC transporter substrate-binding protein [Actinotalea sp. K2]
MSTHALITMTLGALVLTACTPDRSPATTPTPPPDQVEVFSWWASGSEKLALDSLVAEFADQHPGTTFVNGGVAGGAGSVAKDLLRSRIAAGDPPDTFQVHAGAELADHVAAGHLEELTALYTRLGLDGVFSADLLEQVSVDGAVYAVPTAIHRANVVWASTAVLEAAGLDPGTSYTNLDQWFVALEAVAATGRIPLALGSTWTQVHLLETVLLADLGADGYVGLWDGSTDWASPEVTAALEDFERLVGYSDPGRDGLDWPDAAQRVIDGDAAFTVMGDWALALFRESGQAERVDYRWFPVPGTAGTFDLVVDAFTLPVGARRPDAAEAWLDTVSSLSAQTAFSTTKGSIPARLDANPAVFETYQRSALSAYQGGVLVPSLAHGSAVAPAVLEEISAAVSLFTTGGSTVADLQDDLRRAVART